MDAAGRSGYESHGRYHTAVVSPFMPDDGKLAAVRAAMPSLAAGIQLNTGSAGPMPAEAAAAMGELIEYERTIDQWVLAPNE